MVETQIASSAGPRERPITGNTLLFPLVRHPIAQVRAPEVFDALFDKAGVDALCLGLDLPPQDVVAACRLLLASPNVGGMLVTVPYEKVLADAADRLGMAAAHVGAVNALRRCADGKIEGDLFDGHGFVRGLQAAGHASPRSGCCCWAAEVLDPPLPQPLRTPALACSPSTTRWPLPAAVATTCS